MPFTDIGEGVNQNGCHCCGTGLFPVHRLLLCQPEQDREKGRRKVLVSVRLPVMTYLCIGALCFFNQALMKTRLGQNMRTVGQSRLGCFV